MITTINLANIKAFGEVEFWFALIKVVAIIGMSLLGLGIIFLGIGNGVQPVGLDNLWSHRGFMPNGIKGILMSLVLVTFSCGEVELVGIPGAAYIINLVILTAALSAFNSGLFSSGRMLYNLSLQNNGPKYFGKLNENGSPIRGILFTSLILLFAVVLNYIVPEKVFMYISSVATVAMITSWTIILITQIKFRKSKIKQEIEKLAFEMPLYPVSTYLALTFLALVIVLMSFISEMRIALIVVPIWFIILYLGSKIKKRGPTASSIDMENVIQT
ncbi:amino acid permease [Niallia nealsonii]|uniref:amino acid permease n=1 Tax=Niallia nealsonii TaxID=115979 RepID=UPI002E26CD01